MVTFETIIWGLIFLIGIIIHIGFMIASYDENDMITFILLIISFPFAWFLWGGFGLFLIPMYVVGELGTAWSEKRKQSARI